MVIHSTWTLVVVALPLLWVVMEASEAEWFQVDEELERDGLYDDDLWRGP